MTRRATKTKAELTRARNADPDFAAAKSERMRAQMRALNADPKRNPLVALTEAEREDYNVLVRKGLMKRAEALAAIGRGDLIKGESHHD